jgi:hypothetical protein
MILFLAVAAFCAISGCTDTVDERGRISVSVTDTSMTPAAGPSATRFIIYTYTTELRISNTETIAKHNVVVQVHGSPGGGSDPAVCPVVEDTVTLPVLQPLENTTKRITYDRDSNACSYSWAFGITSTRNP